MVNRYEFTLVRGDTWEFEVEFTDQSDSPFDLSNAIVYMTIKEHPSQPDNQAIARVELTNHQNPSLGKAVIVFNPSDTARFIPGRNYVFDVQVVKNGRVYTPIIGSIYILADVTRSA